jgi:protein Tex
LTKLASQRDFLLKYTANEVKIDVKKVENVIALLETGNTVPFIARYRKEQTGALDEVQIREISESWNYLLNLQNRKEEVLRLIEEQGKLTPELQKEINQSTKLQQVEDLYRPYKQKRRTKATIAKEKGLEPLAQWMLTFPLNEDIYVKAGQFISDKNEVISEEEAIQGAVDIIAESISDEPAFRQWIRQETFKKGKFSSVVKDTEKDEKKVYEMYYEYEEAIQKIVPHRVLAMNRGEKEEVLRISIITPVDQVVEYLHKKLIKTESSSVSLWV